MQCKVEGCNKESKYKKDQVCQTHYHRMWRYGTYDTTVKGHASEFRITPNGYRKVRADGHPLADKNNYAFEHRKVLFDSVNGSDLSCEMCGKLWSWRPYVDHVDHIDENRLNNSISNLRPLCNSCNTRRSLKPQHTRKDCYAIKHNGKTMTPTEWAREPCVRVTGRTILHRLRKGMSVEDALFSEKKTHKRKD